MHFWLYRIAKEVTPGEHSCQFCAQVKHLQDYWYCHFVITKDLGMCLTVWTYKEHNISSLWFCNVFVLQVVKRKYKTEYDIAPPPITFAGDHVVLDIPDDGTQTDSRWEIVQLQLLMSGSQAAVLKYSAWLVVNKVCKTVPSTVQGVISWW